MCACVFYIVKAHRPGGFSHSPAQQVKYVNRNALSMVQYCVLLVKPLRSMFTVNDARCTNQLETSNKQRIKQWTNGYFIKIDLQQLAYQPQLLE